MQELALADTHELRLDVLMEELPEMEAGLTVFAATCSYQDEKFTAVLG